MINLTRILVATDFGEASAAALKHGIDRARESGAQLDLLHVIEHPGEAAEAEYPIGLFETMQNAAHDRLRQLLTAEEVRELRPRCSMRIGAPADEIVRYAQERQVDLIVLGTHGREGVARAVMGSVAEKVVRRASCPVLTVHRPDAPFVPVAASVPVSFTTVV